ncbi:3-hydroxyacyl-[acyl-carrier-protein] dehydratase FabZ [Helicobacter cholecystus]|uniref:3-hydroxyacyl-[acyl-carrier-protein] dehydratase FabZ n=1 Tax=Helicobacter cholecystus TaxID=45498 RepID=A0A3D8IYB3_9HELI|nr:3-hydroxyacyl-ACP dehydratase FabZ [Helicobacter cholecystus]RDU70043.1 3-hydroxyacyl-[acyl-carrier-protein] dehydratase FabZ [Helicobacter cholecystus]VEJ24788.1 (3R)-hydroxymyristoyl-ACP dehydratase [Helicobacter cholecystus]
MMDVNIIKKILPHRYPMLLVDRVVDIKPNESIEAYKNVTINEEVFLGHFPKQPIYPGVMIIEGMAQAGGLLAFISMFGDNYSIAENKIVYFMTIDRVKFRIPVVPGDRLIYKVDVIKNKGAIWQMEAKAYVDDKLVSEAELKAMIADVEK